MTSIDRQAAYTGTKDVAAPLRFDTARLEAISRPMQKASKAR